MFYLYICQSVEAQMGNIEAKHSAISSLGNSSLFRKQDITGQFCSSITLMLSYGRLTKYHIYTCIYKLFILITRCI